MLYVLRGNQLSCQLHSAVYPWIIRPHPIVHDQELHGWHTLVKLLKSLLYYKMPVDVISMFQIMSLTLILEICV